MITPEPPTTTPMLPEDEPPIARGQAVATVEGAIQAAYEAVRRLDAIAMAVARALDETSSRGGSP